MFGPAQKLLFFTLAYLPFSGWAQIPDTIVLVAQPDLQPSFGACTQVAAYQRDTCTANRLRRYLNEHLVYPPEAREQNREGQVVISFIIDSLGSIQQVSILRDIGLGCGESAASLVRKMPPWNPARLQGKPVAVRLTLPIEFSLLAPGSSGIKVAWGDPYGAVLDQRLLQNLALMAPKAVNDKGQILPVNFLNVVVKKGRRTRSAASTGSFSSAQLSLLRHLRPGDELQFVLTLQQNGKLTDITRSWQIREKGN